MICILHGISIGLAIDLSSCADVRICAADARLAVKEVDIGLAADIGTLSRLPKCVGSFSWVKDVCLSARWFDAREALAVGFVSQVHETKAAALDAGLEMARLLASKSPVAVQGTKELLNHARDHSVDESKSISKYRCRSDLFLWRLGADFRCCCCYYYLQACDIPRYGTRPCCSQTMSLRRCYLAYRRGSRPSRSCRQYKPSHSIAPLKDVSRSHISGCPWLFFSFVCLLLPAPPFMITPSPATQQP